MLIFCFFLKNYLEDVSPFSGPLMPLFWTSGEACHGLKTSKDPLLACFRACIQWIPQIYLWCDTGWPRWWQAWQLSLFDPHTCTFIATTTSKIQAQNGVCDTVCERCGTVSAVAAQLLSSPCLRFQKSRTWTFLHTPKFGSVLHLYLEGKGQ